MDPVAARPAPSSPSAAVAGERAAARAAAAVVLGGVCAALHVGKLPPAIAALQAALGLTLVEPGFLLSLVQLAGMALGVAFGALADALGLRRSMLIGLGLLAGASALGGAATGSAALMALRAVEGFGFLLVVLPAPGLLRRLVPPQRVARVLGVWGAYMPLATALALLVGPPWVEAFGWRTWWWALAAVSAAMALALARAVPPPAVAAGGVPAPAWQARLAATLRAPGPWLVALTFAMYSGQWLAVVGFLPKIVTDAGVAGWAVGGLTALVAAANIAGNVASGRLLHRGVRHGVLLGCGFVAMAAAAAVAFAGVPPAGAAPAWRYAAVLAFSAVGGLIPAALFALAVRLAPGEHAVSTTVGWVQQWSSLGQFAGPPLVAAVASAAGGWQWTWAATGACSAVGLVLSAALARRAARTAR